MKIRMKESITAGNTYEAGQTYDFPDGVALRWIAAGWAEEVRKKEKKTAEGSTD